VHDLGLILGLGGGEQIVNVVAHNAQTVELEAIFGLASFEGIEQHSTAFFSQQAKLAVIATDGDVITGVGLQSTRLSGHGANSPVSKVSKA
jgi:hypothetical protein